MGQFGWGRLAKFDPLTSIPGRIAMRIFHLPPSYFFSFCASLLVCVLSVAAAFYVSQLEQRPWRADDGHVYVGTPNGLDFRHVEDCPRCAIDLRHYERFIAPLVKRDTQREIPQRGGFGESRESR